MKHLREAMKDGVEKRTVEIQKEKDGLRQAWLKPQKELVEHWLEDIEMVLHATTMTPFYIPTVKEDWIKAVQLKPSTTLGDPGNLPKQPNKPTGPKPAREYVAKKSEVGCQKAGKKDENEEDNSQQDPIMPVQKENLGGQPRDVPEEPLPPGPDPKNSQPPSTDPKDPLKPKPKPKNTRDKPKGPKPKNTAG